MVRNTINSYDSDEKKITLEDLTENGEEKLAYLSDDELKELKQQALDAEDYDICKLIKQEETIRKEKRSNEEYNSIQEEIIDDKEKKKENIKELIKRLHVPERPFIPTHGGLYRITSGSNGLHGCEIKLDNGEHIEIPAKYKKVEMGYDGFIRVSSFFNLETQGLLNNRGETVVPEGSDYDVRGRDRYNDPKYHKEGYAYIYNNQTRKGEWVNNKGEHFDVNTMERISNEEETDNDNDMPFIDLSDYETPFYPLPGGLYRITSGSNGLHGCEIKLDNGEYIEIPAKYKKVEMGYDGFIRVSNTNGVTQGLINNKGEMIIPEGSDYDVRGTDRYNDPKYHKEGYAYIYNNQTGKGEWINSEGEHFDFDTMKKI